LVKYRELIRSGCQAGCLDRIYMFITVGPMKKLVDTFKRQHPNISKH
jgi:hypothetical protein